MEENYMTCGSHNSMCGGGSNFPQLFLVPCHKALVGTQKIVVHHGTIGLERGVIFFSSSESCLKSYNFMMNKC
jgi:hypothetical protein